MGLVQVHPILDFADATTKQTKFCLTKSKKWKKNREGKVSASIIRYILGSVDSQEKAKRILTGNQTKEEIAEVENNPRVMIGTVTEGINKVLLENTLNIEVLNIEPFTHPNNPIHSASPDGVVAQEFCDVPTLIECKHTSNFTAVDTLHARYYPQLQWQLYVTGYELVIMSAIYGNDYRLPDSVTYVERNEEYIAEMVSKVNTWYEKHIINDEPIVDDVAAPQLIPLDDRKIYGYATNNEWVNHAMNFVESKEQHDLHITSKKELKNLIPNDAKTVIGGGVKVNIGKTGRVTMQMWNDKEMTNG
jgi:hypothetical protein